MRLFEALMEELFDAKQCGGETFQVSIMMVTPILCSCISRFSTAGADETSIAFIPPIPLPEALVHARNYTEKGHFEHRR